ncbi:MAG TPA: SAM-dependent methyltransferase [Baekduia sp.]|nr:SAM-dependent methyltransferase [Baekduia sp.]
MTDAYTLIPIGRVLGGRDEVRDDDWAAERATIRLDGARFTIDAVAGLEAFSHLEVVYLFDRVDPDAVETGARHPRGNAAWPRVGIFAQRAKDRPNRLGVSRCALVGVDRLDLRVAGLDAVAGTPVLDIKPYMNEFGPQGQVVQPPWSRELMAGYWSPTS